MSSIELTKDNVEQVISGPGTVLIDFWASWCGPCRMFAPVFDAAAARHADLTFAKVNTEAQPELARAFRVSSIPTLVAIRDGAVLYARPGALPAAALEELITHIRAADTNGHLGSAANTRSR